MMYIGTSLGGCLMSILSGEVSKDDVLFIVTRTNCPDEESFIKVVEGYHRDGNPYSRNSANYELGAHFSLETVLELGDYLWHAGKIHQPRTYGADTGYVHAELGKQLWIEVIPPNKMRNPAVKNLWDQTKMLVSLTQ